MPKAKRKSPARIWINFDDCSYEMTEKFVETFAPEHYQCASELLQKLVREVKEWSARPGFTVGQRVSRISSGKTFVVGVQLDGLNKTFTLGIVPDDFET